jgi:RNA polymerase sigma factor (sigma-70 family)
MDLIARDRPGGTRKSTPADRTHQPMSIFLWARGGAAGYKGEVCPSHPPEAAMTADSDFAGFLCRVRAGDEQAARELVRRYEAAIRLEVRVRLRQRQLRRFFDSMDICQSVLHSFFVRAALGQFDLNGPQDLFKLLVVMTRNKLAYQVRKQRAQPRDYRRLADVDVEQVEAASVVPGPDAAAAGRETLERFRSRLTVEERRLADLRAEGRTWAEIAECMGGAPQARRMQLARAADRVARELGLEV